jgi:hypothetical protein
MKNKTQFLNRTFSILTLVIAFGAQMFSASAAAFDQLQAYGVDTIAGYSALLQTTKTYPNKDVVLVVEKPDGSKVEIPAKTDQSGIAKLDLYDYHTRHAGTYKVSAHFKDEADTSSRSSFTVYPDEVSTEQSTIVAARSVAKTSGDSVYVTVNIRDQYGNPFDGHQIHVISSRSSDSIDLPSSNAVTDENGSLTFTASSSETGVSIFSAVDVTSGVVLSSRAQIAFMSSSNYLADAGGSLSSFIPVANAAAGTLHHFEIGDIPASISANQNVSFRITAKDQDGVTVENYTGTVHFSSEGSNSTNVTLPEDYTFKADDLGTHLFSLGLSFTSNGSYKIVATDVGNTLIKGDSTVVVGSGGSTQQQSGEKPTIVSPSAGSYNSNVQTVTGSATAGRTVKVFDNDQEIGTAQATSSGVYNFQTSPLTDGNHEIYVVVLDASQQVSGTSATVTVTIDTTPPTVDDVVLDPSTGIKSGDLINISMLSEDNLQQVAATFNNEIIELQPSPGQSGKYIGSFAAPTNPGVYPIGFTVVDELSNEATYENKATLTIDENGGTTVIEPTQEVVATQETQQPTQEVTPPENQPPTQVFGVTPYGTDKKVNLLWEAADDDQYVDHYRIYYGLEAGSLDKIVDTKDATPKWYVPELTNGKEYYFAVTAVDNEGVESLNRSELVSAIPFTLEVTVSVPQTPVKPLATPPVVDPLHSAAVEDVPKVSDEGPEVLGLVAFSGVFSSIGYELSRRRRNVRK